MSLSGGRKKEDQQRCLSPSDVEVTEASQDIDDTVILNVGGVRHEVLQSTLQNVPDSLLANLNTLCKHHYRKSKDEYYFDRHPGTFDAILNLYRTGELHVPGDACGPLFKTELDFWCIDDQRIEQCCWIRYNSENDQKNSLVTFTAYTHETETDGLCCQCDAWQSFRAKMWRMLDDPFSSTTAKVYAAISSILIALSIIVLVMETHPIAHEPLSKEYLTEYLKLHPDELDTSFADIDLDNVTHLEQLTSEGILSMPTKLEFHILDWICTVFFTIEWIARLVFCPRKCAFFKRIMNILDLLAILPIYIEVIVHAVNTRERYEHSVLDKLFLLYILRIFRVFRLVQHFKGFQVLAYTLRASWREILLLCFCLSILMLIFGSLIYVAELGQTQTFKSIPASFWWAVVTMTTVGYGDVTPSTNWGYFVGSMCAVSGVLVVAFTVPTMVNNFLLFYNCIQYQKKPPQQHDTCKDMPKENGQVESSQQTVFTADGSPKLAWEEET